MLEKYNPREIEEKWRENWSRSKQYKFDLKAKKPYYVIDTPPPFPTGEFHMGGVLNWCYMDFAARYKRMRGFEVLFPQGWDCHGFPTEVKVEKKHGKGLGKEEFLARCLEWTHDVVGTMKPQMKQMGFSIDWNAEYYTLDKEYYRKVQYSLLKMFEDGHVYRAEHPVLFCTHCRSAIAKAEADDVERETVFNDIIFKSEGKDLVIATTRPELLHACVALLVHPQDARYKKIVGKNATVPVHGQQVPILSDSDVDEDFGTGIVMVCTFGDKQDVVWAYRHKLKVIRACDEAGRLLNAKHLTGLKTSEAKEKIIEELKAKKLLVNQKPMKQVVKIHDRCKKPIELLSSTQWFIRLKGCEDEVKKAASEMNWHPPHMQQLLLDWVNGLEWDWCISRQRFFGIPIPFWYCECGEVIPPKEKDLPVDPSKDAAPAKCKCGGKVIGETSVCDGWVDSSITPLIIAGWPDDKEKFRKLYPAAVRPQGTDIIRTWAFYTTFRCLKLTGKPPFKDMLINGMVLGNDGKKMSKSSGNYVEAKDVIGKSGVDALRQWAALAGSTGKDNVFYWKDVNYAHSFNNKLWNASKFILNGMEGYKEKKAKLSVTDYWVRSKMQKTVKRVTECLDRYEYYEALTAIQSFFWHDVCDNYLEDVKHRVYGKDEESRNAVQATLKEVLDCSLRLLAPFAPFITEEIYHEIHERSVHSAQWPEFRKSEVHEDFERLGERMHRALSEVRKFKASKAMPLNAPLKEIKIRASEELCKNFADVLDDFKAVSKADAVSFEVVENAENKEAMVVECSA
ncbi:valine--tRNA ligase [Candidatus Micrarchaeota archaeon]|nr:valine--tRNA ligase [Candidatus Micrarchaeota archaeon]